MTTFGKITPEMEGSSMPPISRGRAPAFPNFSDILNLNIQPRVCLCGYQLWWAGLLTCFPPLGELIVLLLLCFVKFNTCHRLRHMPIERI